jgi:branched-chain amino acid transport system ATP-binding protein
MTEQTRTAEPHAPAPDALAPDALVLEGVGRRFGALAAVSDVSLSIRPGERRAILGPNGAGKTTLFNTICGDFPPTSGRVLYFGRDISRLKPHRRVRLGIGRTYQSSILFDGLTVQENLFLAVRAARPGRFSLLKTGPGHAALTRVRELARRVGVEDFLEARIDAVSHGQRRQVEIGMALAGEPKLLMLDEPAAGLSAAERPRLIALIGALPRELTLVLIEHDMDVALSNADLVTVMKDGRVVAENTPDRIVDDPTVQAIYLGKGH